VILLLAAIFALLFLNWPWNVAVVVAAAVCEPIGITVAIRWTRHRRSQVGAQTLIGARATVVTALAPIGQVRLGGEIWQARCEGEARIGDTVLVTGVDGLTLEVERVSG
jgi:membrane protein implicated in regulation of membrane protease activity